MPRRDRQRTAYHHGDLRRVLLVEATALLNERGFDGFSVREVARRARVAPGAPSHHFGNATGLLTAVATDGFRQLVVQSKRILVQDRSPVDRVSWMGESYIGFARTNPGIYSIMFRSEVLDDANTDFAEARSTALQLLRQAVRSAVSESATEDRIDWLTKALWAMLHGMVTLRIEEGEKLGARVALTTRALLAGADTLAASV